MASTTLCFSGFARDELAQAQQQFEEANARIGHRWSLASEADAGVLVIDMDSMYGHMTWLKAASGGRTTVGLTAGERCETDYLLRRPMSAKSLQALLAEIASGAPAPAAVPDARHAEPEAVVETEAEPEHRPSADYMAAVTTGRMAAIPANLVPHQPSISDFMAPGVLKGPVRIALPGAPALLLDPASQGYAGSPALKPLIPYVQAVLEPGAAESIAAADFAQASSGGTQPWMRLLWLCGLVLGEGNLLPGFTAAKKFHLTKWPQIEREFPKHFRIATVMMKGPALVKDIAEACGATAAEVSDFINAGLVSGAVVAEGAGPVGGDPARASALLARPRGA